MPLRAVDNRWGITNSANWAWKSCEKAGKPIVVIFLPRKKMNATQQVRMKGNTKFYQKITIGFRKIFLQKARICGHTLNRFYRNPAGSRKKYAGIRVGRLIHKVYLKKKLFLSFHILSKVLWWLNYTGNYRKQILGGIPKFIRLSRPT